MINSTLPLSLANKRVLLGVSGGIAAYKSADLVRRLQDLGAEVKVVMTRGAQEFITPLTMQALSGHPVHTELLDPEAEAGMGHIELARWGDLILIAPATANFMATMTMGRGDDLLSTLCLAARGKIAIAPAMNQAMWADQATQQNLNTLLARGVSVFGPDSGGQACGDVGMGRMLSPDKIAHSAAELFPSLALSGKHVVITAGPTREPIDPVRYISNYSSGKMGYALAQAAIEAGAKVTLVSGPVSLKVPDRVSVISVTSACEMHAAALEQASQADIFIGSAAVADFRPAQSSDQKIKKGADDRMVIELIKNPDIIADVAKLERKLVVIGFAAETQNVEEYARTKLKKKNLDYIIANDVSRSDIGFNADENEVTVIGVGSAKQFDARSKQQLARDLVAYISSETFQPVQTTERKL